MNEVVTHAKLTSALEQAGFEEPADKALLVLNYFGYGTYITDNPLPKPDRKLFYELSTAGILGTAQEETQLPDGRAWRIFYWTLNLSPRKEETPKKETVYESLAEFAWTQPGLTALPEEMRMATNAIRRLKPPLLHEVAEFAKELLKTLKPVTVKTYVFDLCSALHDLGGQTDDEAVAGYLELIKSGKHPSKKNVRVYGKALARFRTWRA